MIRIRYRAATLDVHIDDEVYDPQTGPEQFVSGAGDGMLGSVENELLGKLLEL